VAAVCCAGAVLAAAAYAAVDARLEGPFDVRITVVRGNLQKPGTEIHRRWRFEPLCNSGPCQRVRFIRHGPHHSRFKSLLHRRDRGTYQGRERTRVNCGDGQRGRQVIKTHLRIKKRSGEGAARKVKGRGRIRIIRCHLHERAKFVGHSVR
jgi:hypothetical protein